MLSLLLIGLAILLFVLAAFGVSSKVNLTAAGLACWAASQLPQFWPR